LTANGKAVLKSGELWTERVNQRARAEGKQKEKGYMGIQHSRTSKILKTVNDLKNPVLCLCFEAER
jgi:hypothetical protein